jgi:hypothetical protein
MGKDFCTAANLKTSKPQATAGRVITMKVTFKEESH